MDTIKWSQIEAECGGYRAGFVATFKKYKGLPTDEKDAQGRIVKVTGNSFARHAGVAESTFKGWIREQAGDRRPGGLHPTRIGQTVRQAVKSDSVSIEDKIGMLEDLTSDPKVLRAYREHRAPNVTEADAKAANAIAKALTDPIARSASKLQLPMWLDQLRTIREVLSEYEFDDNEIAQLDRALRKVMDEVEVQKFRLGMEVGS